MSTASPNNSGSLLYRFLDTEESTDDQNHDIRVLRVEYYPSIDDYVKITEKAAREFPLPWTGKLAMQAFVVVNQVGWPAILFYFDLWLPALVVFVVNTILAVAVLPILLRVDYRRFYRHYFPNLESELAAIEIHPRGVWYQTRSASSFFSWDSFTAIDETDEVIVFRIRGGHGIPVRKTGFAYEAEKSEFLALARQRFGSQRSLNE